MQRAEAWGTVIGVGAGLAIAAIRNLRQEAESRAEEIFADDHSQANFAPEVPSSSDNSIFDGFAEEETEKEFDEESLYEEDYKDEEEGFGMTMM